MPGAALGFSRAPSHLLLTMALLCRYHHHHAHFTDEKVQLREAKQFARGLPAEGHGQGLCT